jgi:hypothetical protein
MSFLSYSELIEVIVIVLVVIFGVFVMAEFNLFKRDQFK